MEIRQLETFVHVAQLQSFPGQQRFWDTPSQRSLSRSVFWKMSWKQDFLTEPESVWCLLRPEKSLWSMQAGSYMM